MGAKVHKTNWNDANVPNWCHNIKSIQPAHYEGDVFRKTETIDQIESHVIVSLIFIRYNERYTGSYKQGYL